ncbi:MAG TPA: helicase-related protein [Anaerolineae bacterium]|nr:helicase-related protein [Anaerolineae bacterium]HQH38049.1 helicase-related protein [Anaerolineae bacterium]
MPHDIIDNRTDKLVDAIRRVLPGAQAAKFAVGYFFLSGLEAVADQLYNVGELRLLIGNTSNRETIEQIAEGYRRLEQVHNAVEAIQYPKRAAIEAATAATAQSIGQTAARMDQTDEAAQLVDTLVALIESGRLKVRVYTQGRLHAKAYIFDYPPNSPYGSGMAIVGSSNFTLSGIAANTELNVKVLGDANHAALTHWFEDLWDEAQDFETHLMQELRQSWPLAQVTPYEVYLKTLYELVRDQLEGVDPTEFLWQDDITAVLTEFQERAVRQAVQMIRRYGGCFVADVVGLGKSYIGAAIVKHFERHDRARTLIICPAPLVEMWEYYNEVYQLNARVLSLGMLREDDQYGPEWMLHDERYRYRDFVLVDESHNFRNTDNQRYRVLQSYLATGERRVVFLTATPRNKSVWDIYHQLKLFHPTDLTQLPIDPPNLRTYFKAVEDGQKRLPELLAHLLIRRTRTQILRWYGYDAETHQRVDPDNFAPYKSGTRRAYVKVAGREQFFPKRELETISYSIEAAYGGFYDELRGYLTLPSPLLGEGQGEGETLTFARYGLWHYVIPAKQEQPPYADLKRAGANLRGLLRVMLFKRLESSVHAFRETVRRILRIHELFVSALDQGIIAAGEEAQQLLYESDQDEEQALFDALAVLSGRYLPADFDLVALRADVLNDIGILHKMLALVKPITPERDAKLQTLQTMLTKAPLNCGKVLIFTQYADTAQYLYDNLVVEAGTEIDVIYSRDKSKAQIVARFAPKANPQLPLAGMSEIDTLIATDVLSEGLNLQDCDNVINYDLHWNPVRLIQRFGRIDRIGSAHESIYAYNFLPERELERTLGLQERLAQRIQEIHDTIGEDAAILAPDERLNEEALYAIYTRGDISRFEEDEVDQFVDMNEALEIVRQLREDNPDLYRHITELRDGIRCGYANGRNGAVVFCRAGRYRQLYLVDEHGDVLTRDAPHILNLMKCTPDTPAAPLPTGHNATVMQVKRDFDHENESRQSEQQHTLALTKAQRYVLAELRILYAESDDNLRQQIAILDAAFQQPITRPAIRTALNRIRRESLTGRALLETLTQLYHVHGLDALLRQERDHGEENDALSYIVCSEGFVE